MLKASEYSAAGVPVVSVGEIRRGYIEVLDRTPRVSEEVQLRLPQFVLEEGDIVFGRKGGIDRNALIGFKESGWFLGSDGIRLRLSGAVDSTFVSYQFRSPAIGKWLLGNSSGSIMPSLNEGVLGRLPLWLPEFDEQQKIAAVLSTLDAKIDLNNRINAELEALAKTVYDYWFVQFDFPDAHGRPYKSSGGAMVWNDTLKREIPAGWETVRLGSLVDCNANSYSANDLPSKIVYLDTGNLTENRLFDLEEYDTNKEEVPSRARRIAGNGDVLYSTVRPNQNHHGIIKEAIGNFVVSTGFSVLTCTDKHLGGDFIYMFIRANEVATKMQRIAESSRSSYPSIAPDDLLDLGLAVPEDRAQVINACQFFDQTFKTVWTNEKQNHELTQLRDWLLPLLMNGQVRVA